MSFKFSFLAVALSTVWLLHSVHGAYDYSSNCTFYQPNVPACPGATTTSTADFIKYFTNGTESYAVISDPNNVFIVCQINYVCYPSSPTCNIFVNGVFAYVIYINGTFYILTLAGCPRFYQLPNDAQNVQGTDFAHNDLLRVVNEQYKRNKYSFNVPCSVVEFTNLVGPTPPTARFLTGSYGELITRGIQSAVIDAGKGNGCQLASAVRIIVHKYHLNVIVTNDNQYVYVTQNTSPQVPRCVPQSRNPFANTRDLSPITDERPNSACYLSLTLAARFANPDYNLPSLTYSVIAIVRLPYIIYVSSYLSSRAYDSLGFALVSAC